MTVAEYFSPARMTVWDGTSPHDSRHRYPVENSTFSPYYIDDAGTIFYTAPSGKLVTWCAASRFAQHWNHLQRVGALKEA